MKRVLLLLAVALAACSGPTDPETPEDNRRRGPLIGLVTIGPNCPAAQQPCDTPAEAYAARKILVFNEERTRLLFTVDIDSRGFYRIALLPGKYVVDFQGLPMDRTGDVPKTVTMVALTETRLDINIDTGIR
jgi:hypothetical protein